MINELNIIEKLENLEQLIQQESFSDSECFRKAKELSLKIVKYLPKCFLLEEDKYDDYSKKIKSLHDRVISKAASSLKPLLPEIFSEYQIYQKYLTRPNYDLKDLVVTKLFLASLINKICEDIENFQGVSQGLVYRITNQEGIHHYLIGTLHQCNQSMAKAPLLKHALNQSQELHLESHDKAMWMIYTLRLLNKFNPYRFSIDHTLKNVATQQNKPVQGLEKYHWKNVIVLNIQAICASLKSSLNSHLDNAVKVSLKQGRLAGFVHFYSAPLLSLINKQVNFIQSAANFFQNKQINNPSTVNPDRVHTALMQYFWQLGVEDFFSQIAFFQNIPEELLDRRNRDWLSDNTDRKGLLTTRHGDKPACYAVGTLHLFGKEGLLHRIEKDGFTIEKGFYSESGIAWNSYP